MDGVHRRSQGPGSIGGRVLAARDCQGLMIPAFRWDQAPPLTVWAGSVQLFLSSRRAQGVVNPQGAEVEVVSRRDVQAQSPVTVLVESRVTWSSGRLSMAAIRPG